MSTKAIRARILEDLATIDGTEGFTFDLSHAGQVASGKYQAPPGTVLPFVSVYTAQVAEVPGKSLRHFEQRGLWIVTGWAKANARQPGSVQDAAEDLADDIRKVLRADRTLGGLVLGHTTEATPFEPKDQRQGRMFGVCMVVVKAWWREQR